MKTLVQFLVLSSFFFASVLSFAANKPQNLQLRLGDGRVVYFEYAKATKKDAPTFLLMPGVNRSLLLNESGPKELIARGYGVAAMNFSVQPFSVDALEKNETPFFMTNSKISLADLAAEVQELATDLKEQFQVSDVIPVSLSYSGAVSPFLKNFPVIVEAVPLTSGPAQNPQLEQYRQSLKMGEFWNPIFGPGITRNLLDQAYRSKWSEQVDAISNQFAFDSSRKDQMIEGYTVLSRATEGYEWDLTTLPSKTRRVFMFAANESKSLLQHQVNTFLALYAKDKNVLLFVVKNSGHVIPSDQPESYAGILDLVAQGKTDKLGGVIEVDPDQHATKTYQNSDAKTYLQGLVDSKE
ncbi:hypothetical protein [Bdellovibrio sp. NC01]|uniref:hypothetical protein n=1 Tax=Bdellovibrio sp. NC01 TaxID=2220073 RepID=UPI00115A6509|nr:hypothetical protein [Bdellovibrio sp. NC01]QDK37003.1 hypothetical protein DOE51_05040 [Bdellovibrio sp. NC01]